MTDVKQTAERVSTERLEGTALRVLQLIADGYTAKGDGMGEYVQVENPQYQPDNGHDPYIVLDVKALASRHADAQEGGEVERTIAGETVSGVPVLGWLTYSDVPGVGRTAKVDFHWSTPGANKDVIRLVDARALNPRRETVGASDTKNTVSDERFAANLREHAVGYGSHVVGALLIEAADRLQSLRASIPGGVGVKGLTDYLWQEFCELPGRSSPEDYPDMALVNQSELAAIVETFFEHKSVDLLPAEGKSDRDMRDGMDCNYPDCGCCFDSKCSDAPVAAPSNPVVSDEVWQAIAPYLRPLVDFAEVRAAITAALSVNPQIGSDKP